MRKLKNYTPTKLKAKNSIYSKEAANRAVYFIEFLKHTDEAWYKKSFELLDWQEQIIKNVFGFLSRMDIDSLILPTSKYLLNNFNPLGVSIFS